MSVRYKLLLLISLVALLPLSALSWVSHQIYGEALDQAVSRAQQRLAQQGARAVEARLQRSELSLRLLLERTIPWRELTPAERDGALWLLYAQEDDFAVLSLLDGEGRGIGASAYQDPEAPTEAGAGHPLVMGSELTKFAQRIPWPPDPDGGLGVGTPFVVADQPRGVWLPLLWPVEVANGGEVRAVAAGLAIETLCLELPESDTGTVLLLDPAGRELCRGATSARLESSRASQVPVSVDGLLHYSSAEGELQIAGKSTLSHGLSVIAEQPRTVAFAANQVALRRTQLAILFALALAVFVGLILARGITRPVVSLTEGVSQLGSGRYDYRVPLEGGDEFAKLAAAFNTMAEQIESQNAEIRGWNEELSQRVEERTHRLEETHAQLLESQRVATMSQLGAGIAHEVNNPLTSVLGVLQLIRARLAKTGQGEREVELLASAEGEALRIRRLVKQVLDLTQSRSSARLSHIQPNDLVRSTLALMEAEVGAEQQRVALLLGEELPPVLGNLGQLQQALLQVLRNAVEASPSGAEIVVSTRRGPDDTLEVSVQDSGPGVPAAIQDKIFEPFFSSRPEHRHGLGLSLALRILVDHGGRIRVTNLPKGGSEAVLTLPMRQRAHMI